MAAHRYWRVDAIEAYGRGALAMSELHLLAGTTRVDAAATLTSNIAPATGSLANLKDDVLSTEAAWPASTVAALALFWDFGGSPQDVTDVRIGAAGDALKFPIMLRLTYSDDNWTTSGVFYVFVGIMFPGARKKTDSVLLSQSAQIAASTPAAYYKLDETSGTAYADSSGNGRTATGSGSMTQGVDGLIPDSSKSLVFNTTTSFLSAVDPLGASYTGSVTMRAVFNAPAAGTVLSRGRDGSGAGWSLALAVAATGAVSFTVVIGSTAFAATTPVGFYSLGTLIEAVGVYPKSTGALEVWLNGMLLGRGTAPTTGAIRDSTFGFGMNQSLASTEFPIAGLKLDEVAVWSRALSGDEIRNLADAQKIRRNPLARGRASPYVGGRAPSLGSTPVPSLLKLLPRVLRVRRDYVSGVLGAGVGRVKGTTKDKGSPNVPVSERVRLYREQDGMLVRETWSTPGTGAYSFDYVDELQTYTVISYDHDKTFRAVVADNLTLAGGGVELIA